MPQIKPGEWISAFKGLSASTMRTYQAQVYKFLMWRPYNLPPEWLHTPEGRLEVLQKYKRFLLEGDEQNKPCKPNTVNTAINAINKWFVYSGIKPVEIARLEPAKQAPKALTKEELARVVWMVKETAKLRDKAILFLLIYSGLRRGEVHQLNVGDVQVTTKSGIIRVRAGKGMKYREVPIHNALRPVLVAYMKTVDKSDRFCPLWTGAEGKRLSYRAIDDIVRKIGLKVGIPLSAHKLRHT